MRYRQRATRRPSSSATSVPNAAQAAVTFHDATSEPHPSPQPEIWVGGSSERAIRRALEVGDAWHPSRGSDADHVRRVKEQHPSCS
jgi:alkanesulfonate monooxygenase SsuD/methylene tetrahydromethanopterin reductase-like flavin-dependent oxidoreductase (luciferase family)